MYKEFIAADYITGQQTLSIVPRLFLLVTFLFLTYKVLNKLLTTEEQNKT